MAAGTVVRDPGEAAAATLTLLQRSGAVVVKQAHNGAGVGNELLVTDPTLATGHAGARHLHHLGRTDLPAAAAAYWRERWTWASADGRFPVVLEEFIPGAFTVYCEQHLTETGTQPTERGELRYTDRRLSHESVPCATCPRPSRSSCSTGPPASPTPTGPLATAAASAPTRSWGPTDGCCSPRSTPRSPARGTSTRSSPTTSCTRTRPRAHRHRIPHPAGVDLARRLDLPPRARRARSRLRPRHPQRRDRVDAHRRPSLLGAQFTFSTVHASPADRDAIWHALEDRFTTTSSTARRTDSRKALAR